LIEIINKQLLLQLVGYLCYWQMGFNSVFKGLKLEGHEILFLIRRPQIDALRQLAITSTVMCPS